MTWYYSLMQDGDGILCQFIQVTDIAMDETRGIHVAVNFRGR